MSQELIDIEKRYEHLLQIYEQTYQETEGIIHLDSVMLKDALKNQIELQLQWELIVKKFNKVYDVCELIAESAYAEAVSKELKDAYKNTSISEAREFAKANPVYKKAKRLLIDIRETRDEARGILDTVQSRKYILNNITNSVVSNVENHII